MKLAPKQPWKICRVGGREFKIHLEYDDIAEQEIGIYPDFREQPQYTDEGRPFTMAVDEGCSFGKPQDPARTLDGDYSAYGDCGGCAYFHREETPYDAIGICMCDALRRE